MEIEIDGGEMNCCGNTMAVNKTWNYDEHYGCVLTLNNETENGTGLCVVCEIENATLNDFCV